MELVGASQGDVDTEKITSKQQEEETPLDDLVPIDGGRQGS